MTHEQMESLVKKIGKLKERAGNYRASVSNTENYGRIELNGVVVVRGDVKDLTQAERSTLSAVSDLCRWKIRDIEKQIAELENSVVHYPPPRFRVGVDTGNGGSSITAVYDTKAKKIVGLSEVDDSLDEALGEAIKNAEQTNSRIAAEGWPAALKRENMPKPEPQGGENPNEVRIPVLQRYMGKPSGTPGELAMKYVSQVLPPSGARGTLRRPTCDEMDLAKKHPRYKPYPGAGEPVLAVKWATKYDFTAPAEKRNTYFAVAWSNADGWWVSHNIAVSHGLVSKDGSAYLQCCPHGCPATDRYNKYGECEAKHICMYDRIGPEQTMAPVSNHLPMQPPPPTPKQVESVIKALGAAEQTMNELLSGTEWSDEEMKAVKEARDRELLRRAGIVDPEKLIPFIRNAGGIDKCAAVPDLTPEEKAALARLMDGEEPAKRESGVARLTDACRAVARSYHENQKEIQRAVNPIPPECSTDSGPLVEMRPPDSPLPKSENVE